MENPIEREVLNLLGNEYFGEFTDIYATCVALSEIHPEQVSNEIRNAVTHLYRALQQLDDEERAKADIAKAKDHLTRAKRDCLKIAIITARTHIDELIYRIETAEGALPRAVHQRSKTFIRKRRNIFVAETNGCNIDDDLQNMLVELLEFQDELQTQHNDPGASRHKWRMRLRRPFRIASAIAIGAIGSLLATAILVAANVPGAKNFATKLLSLFTSLLT